MLYFTAGTRESEQPIHKILGCCFSAMVLKKLGSSANTLAAHSLFFSNKPSKLSSLISNLLTAAEGKADLLERAIFCLLVNIQLTLSLSFFFLLTVVSVVVGHFLKNRIDKEKKEKRR